MVKFLREGRRVCIVSTDRGDYFSFKNIAGQFPFLIGYRRDSWRVIHFGVIKGGPVVGKTHGKALAEIVRSIRGGNEGGNKERGNPPIVP